MTPEVPGHASPGSACRVPRSAIYERREASAAALVAGHADTVSVPVPLWCAEFNPRGAGRRAQTIRSPCRGEAGESGS